jgi:hypothetical protein
MLPKSDRCPGSPQTEERLDPTNPEHLRRARILAEIMVSRTSESFSTPARFIDLSKHPNQPL